MLGRGTGPVLRLLVGSYTPGDPPVLVAQRAVAADVDARASLLAGGRAFGTLRREGCPADAPGTVVEPLLADLGIWVGGSDGKPYDAVDRTASVQRMAGRLAHVGALVVRDGPVRLCPSCGAPRSPERTVYHEEVGDTLLIRFPLEADGDSPAVEALAWVDAPWRVLGTTALLVNADLPYVTVEYRRGEVTARLLTLRSSLARLQSWLSAVELTVVEEKPGKAYVGRRYVYPLRHEFPDGASLPPPSGTVQAVAEVGDSGTGVVPLVPGHGGSDAQIAERLGIQGWPLLTVHGTLDLTLMHKYAGLDVETASEFVARDLTEAGSVLARLRVLRGVPYCGVCGHPLVWFPGRCWCLEPGHLPPEQIARYARILPHDRPVREIEVTPWAVSETTLSDAPEAVTLLECDRCFRMDAPDGPTSCTCGGRRRKVSRRLVPSIAGALAGWARNDPVPPGDPVRLYLGERRRAPTVVHQLAAMAAVDASSAEVTATVLPTVTDVDVPGLVAEFGADAVRSAFVRTASSEGPGGSFVERCRQEHHRLARLLDLAATTAAAFDRGGAAGGASASLTDRDLEPEDRALLARWAATELRVLAAYEELRPAEAHRRIVRFLELDLARYRELVRPREGPEGAPASRRASARALGTVLAQLATALAPIAPFTAESVVRTLRPEPRSLFETEPFDLERPPMDDTLSEAWERWLAVVRAAERFRLDHHLAPRATIPSVAVVVADDELGDRLRGDRSLLQRLAGLGRLEVGSPRSPWEGRRRQVVPVESEIQKAFPTASAQVLHLLRRMPARKPGDVEAVRGFSVFVQGHPHQITPEMLTVVESLPERVVPTPFALGEMYAELPGGSGVAAETPVALSADAAWLVRRIARRLRTVGPDGTRSLTVRVIAVDPLARELRERWAAVAAALGVGRLTIDAPAATEPARPTLAGRTRLGARWAVEIPGLERRRKGVRRPSARAPPGATRRMPLRRPGLPNPAAEVDFTDEQVIQHEDAVRALGEQLDKLLDAPLLGPAKVTLAWQAGYASVDDITGASFDELATLPGFGRSLAARLFTKLGREVPPPPPRARPPVGASLSSEPEPPQLEAALLPAGGAPGDATGAPGPGGRSPPTVRWSPSTAPPSPPRVREHPGTAEPTGPVPPADEGLPPTEVPPSGPFVPVPSSPAEPERMRPASPPAARPPPPLEPAYLPESARAPSVAAPAPSAPAPPARSGLEVEVSRALLPALQPFLDATAAGHRGLAVVRELPERVRTLVGPRPVAVYWLSNLVRERAIRPGDLAGLASLIRQGIAGNAISAVFLEGVEYLTRIHGSAAVVGFLKELDEQAREHGSRVWLHLTPGLLTPAELEQVVRDLGAPTLSADSGPDATPPA
jgi:hypothetical protein